MNDRNRNDVALIIGIVILVAGVAALTRNLGILPPFVLDVWNMGRRATGPLALVVLGIVLILLATGSMGRPRLPGRDARLYRSRSDRWIAGVCGGIAAYLDVDPLIVRAVYVLLTLGVNTGFGVIAYIVLAIVVPEEPAGGTSRA